MIVEILAICGVAVLFYIFRELSNIENLPPGPFRFPIVGSIFQLALTGLKTKPFIRLQTMSKKYGPLTWLEIGRARSVLINDLDIAKDVLCSDEWVGRFWDDYVAERSFGQHLGLLFVSGDVHKEMRRFSTRTLRDFGFGKKKSMEAFISEEISDLLQHIDQRLDANPQQPLCVKHFFTISVLNILWTMLAGYRFSHDDAKLKELITLMEGMSKAGTVGENLVIYFPALRPIIRYTKSDQTRTKALRELHAFFRNILEERRSTQEYQTEQKDFIDVFMKEIDNHKQKETDTHPNYYTDEQFISVSLDLFNAGSETTSNTLEFGILYMILNHHVQVKVQNEIDKIVGSSRLPTSEDKSRMPYTEATLLEIQRMANVLPVIFRGNPQKTCLGQYDIPKDSVAIMNMWSIHFSKSIWKDPFVFNPERFLDDNLCIVNANKILPFGLGKRVCLGETLARASLFTFFTSLLQKYTFEKSPFHPEPTTDPDVGFTMCPKRFSVSIKPRTI